MTPDRSIQSVCVIGSGTMGMGIAALAAQADCRVLLLDVDRALADKAVQRMTEGRSPALEDAGKAANIITGSTGEQFDLVADFDWICEAVVENLEIKRDVFRRIEAIRKDGSIITTNTSGIPLRDITRDLPERLRHDVAVTHFFNPVKVMRLLELVPGEDTDGEVIDELARFSRDRLGKGVVYAKDTVNFIGNRIGCFWMLAGLHIGRAARGGGLDLEDIDAVMSAPLGLPATGLYGLVDLVGLDVMDLVAKNLDANLPAGDAGREFVALPPEEQDMLARGQLGRKTGGGYYRVTKLDDGGRLKETFDPAGGQWRTAKTVELDDSHSVFGELMRADDALGRFAWDVMSGTLCYAADLVPDIADDIVNIDRAMRWGFAWRQGPFELIDAYGAREFAARLEDEGRPTPKMIRTLLEAGAGTFYSEDGSTFLGVDGRHHDTPPE